MSEEQQANNSGSKLLSGIVVLGCICLGKRIFRSLPDFFRVFKYSFDRRC